MQGNLVSIITPCYNAGNFISDTIKSVISQSYPNWEMLIIDDCSTDKSLLIIQEFCIIDSRIKCIRMKKNSGVAATRNIGITETTGKYIAFLDSDDLWEKTKLEKQIRFMEENNYNFSYTAYKKIDSSGQTISSKISVPDIIIYSKLLKHNQIACLTAMYNAEFLGKWYFENIGHEDYYYWLSITRGGITAHGLNEVLASYRVRGSSVSGNKIRAALFTWNIYRNHENFSFITSLYYFGHYAFKSLRKFLK